MEFNLIRFIFIDHQTDENSNSIYSFYSMFQFLENLIRDFSILSIYKKSRRKENHREQENNQNTRIQQFNLQKMKVGFKSFVKCCSER